MILTEEEKAKMRADIKAVLGDHVEVEDEALLEFADGRGKDDEHSN